VGDEVVCPRCGHRNGEGSNFCSSCGEDLSRVRADTTTAMHPVTLTDSGDDDLVVDADSLPPGVGMLVVKRGPNEGSRFVLDRDATTAGRHPDSDIFLDDVTVSRRHVEIHRAGDGYRVRDAGSLNGTYLNRERVDDAAIASGDELQIGKYKLLFLLPRP
jgi:pSer/pThr/pTyr-binding forkhead associated (FHA) protein